MIRILTAAVVAVLIMAAGLPSADDALWILVAMIGARTLAMGLNRLIDAGVDARNPRTASRELPAGKLSVAQVAMLCVASQARAAPLADPGAADGALAGHQRAAVVDLVA